MKQAGNNYLREVVVPGVPVQCGGNSRAGGISATPLSEEDAPKLLCPELQEPCKDETNDDPH